MLNIARPRNTKYFHSNTGDSEDKAEQISIQAALKNQQEVNKRQKEETLNLLEGQILFANFVHAHGLPSSCFTCFGVIAEKIFPD